MSCLYPSRSEIRKLEVEPGETLQVCHRKVEVLGEPCIEWMVSRMESSQSPKAPQVGSLASE